MQLLLYLVLKRFDVNACHGLLSCLLLKTMLAACTCADIYELFVVEGRQKCASNCFLFLTGGRWKMLVLWIEWNVDGEIHWLIRICFIKDEEVWMK